MTALTRKQDAFGLAIRDCHAGRPRGMVIERDDGWVTTTGGPGVYFRPYEEWSAAEKQAVSLARGRVLDIGCGAGRHALYLQSRGLSVTGIDNSPLALRVCRLRGLRKARLVPITQVGRKLGRFDTVLMLGNNFGLFGGFGRARRLLCRFVGMTSPAGRIIAQSADPYQTDVPEHRAYHRANRRRGRMGGQVRIRVRYKNSATPWWDLLLVSRDEMRRIVAGTGWRITRFVDTDGPGYFAVLEKEPKQ